MSENLKKQLVVIDGIIANAEEIVSVLSEEQEVLILSENNGLDEVKAYLAAKGTQYETIHFITHGSDGALSINGETVTNSNLKSEDWAVIGAYLTDTGDLLFYGCELAKSDEGKRLIDAIAVAANADAAASIDLTGAGGDWELEYVSGDLASRTITVEGYNGNLEDVTKKQTWKSSTSKSNVNYKNIDGDAIKIEDAKKNNEVYSVQSYTLTNCTWRNNKSGIKRGKANNLTITGSNTVFEGNARQYDGVCVYMRGYWHRYKKNGVHYEEDGRGEVKIDSVTFQYNVAGNDWAINKSGLSWSKWKDHAWKHSDDDSRGGALYARLEYEDEGDVEDDFKYSKDNMMKLTVSNCTFSHNAAVGVGGAVVGDSYTWYVFDNCTFERNGSGKDSYITIGAEYYGTTYSSSSCSKGEGGAILLYKSALAEFTSAVTFSGNLADGKGGAIAVGMPKETKNILKIIKALIKLPIAIGKFIVAPEVVTAEKAAKIIKKSVKSIADVSKKAFQAGMGTVDGNGEDDDSSIHSEILFHENATFQNNEVLCGQGGAIYLGEHAIAAFQKGVTFTGNKASTSGGAVYMENNTTFISVEGVTCTNNRGSYPGNGGAFYIGNQSIAILGKSATFTSNSVVYGKGGAIYAVGTAATLAEGDHQTTLVTGDVTFKNNSGSTGGALYCSYTNSYFFGKAVFDGNTSNQGMAVRCSGLSTLNFYDTVEFKNNKSTVSGTVGALELYGNCTCTFYSDVTFTGNYSTSGCKIGAIYASCQPEKKYEGDANCRTAGTITISGKMTLNSNQYVILRNGYTFVWNVTRDGQDAYLTDYSLLDVDSSVTLKIRVNETETTARTSYVLAGNAGNAKSQTFTLVGSSETKTIKVGGSTSLNGYTYSLAINSSNQLVLNVSGGVTKDHHVVVAKNQSFMTDGTFEGYTKESQGGAIFVDGVLELYDCTLKNNYASSQGGAIYVDKGGTAYLENVTFSGNTAANAGGAVYNDAGTIRFSASVTLATATDVITNDKGTLDWLLSSRFHGYVSDFSRISNSGTLTITLTPEQLSTGKYKLASNVTYNPVFTVDAYDAEVVEDETNKDGYTVQENKLASVAITANDGRKYTLTESCYVSLYTDSSNDLYLEVSSSSQLTLSAAPLTATASTLAAGNEEPAESISDGTDEENINDDSTESAETLSVQTARIVVSNGEYTISDGTVFDRSEKTFSGDGGAIYVESTGILTNDGEVTFSNGSATGNGGAVYNCSGTVTLANAAFNGSSASQGGAIYNNGALTLNDITFNGNTASLGGAIYNGGTLTINGKVSLESDSDTIYNAGTINWNLAAAAIGHRTITISDWSLVSGPGNCTVTVGALGTQIPGNYTLAENVSDTFSITLQGAGADGVTMTVSKEDAVDYYVSSTRAYQLKLENHEVTLKLENHIEVSQENYPLTDGVYTIADGKRYEYTARAGLNGRGDVFFVCDTGTLTNGTEDAVTFTGCSSILAGGAVFSYGTVDLHNATFSENSTNGKGGAVYISTGDGSFTGSAFTNNSANNGGAIANEGYNSMTLTGVTFNGNTATENGGAICNLTGGWVVLNDVTFNGNTAADGGAIYNEGTISVCGHVTLATNTDTIVNNGTLNWNVSSGSADKTDFAVSDWSLVSGTGDLTLTVGSFEEQYCTTYVLAENVESFTDSITVKDLRGTKLGTLSTENALVTSDSTYTLALNGTTLSVTITSDSETPHGLSGAADGVTWQSSADSFAVQYTKDYFTSVLEVQTKGCGVDTYALSEGTYDWQVKTMESTLWSQEDMTVTSEYEPEQPTAWGAEANGQTDLFFANASGTWSSGYVARNEGLLGGWTGTRETTSILGKNKLADTFTGADDANILVLTDDNNGDALFVDDVYTAFPAEHQARIAQIDEIRAGAGDDVVDLTSQRYEYVGDGVIVRGGSGSDTIWANKGENKLFGDAGNDRLVGATGDDVLSGGIGDDRMHGGGGDDVFTFCDDWGSDTVEQLANGSVTLWFKSGSEANWDQATMTYTDGDNTVKVSGVSSVTLKFGNDETQEYAALAASGCFLAESSAKIFEDSEKGVLA